MGLENREYLRSEYDDGYNSGPPRGPMAITTKIILVTVGVFIIQLITAQPGSDGSRGITDWLQLDQEHLFQGQIWRLVTYAFAHSLGNILHIAFNMFALWSIGRAVLRLMNEREFVAFYLCGAVFSGIVFISFRALIHSPAPAIGASGALSAMVAMFVLHFPNQQLALFGVFNFQARKLLTAIVLFELFQCVGMIIQNGDPFLFRGRHMAHSAHLGGFLFGYLYVKWHMNLTMWWGNVAGRVQVPKRRNPDIRVYNPGTQPEVDLSSKVDAILDKISREGEESLTERERRILTQASENLKNKR